MMVINVGQIHQVYQGFGEFQLSTPSKRIGVTVGNFQNSRSIKS
jgi:hypothetical protein